MNKINPLISVIVPVYNVEKYLERCLNSIVNQSYENLEIILVDDGSTDNSGIICDKWAEKDDRVVVIHKKNGGLSDARNWGMKEAHGAFIGFVDSDDWIAKDMYEKLINAIERDGSDIAACGVQMVWEDSEKTEMLTHNRSCVLSNQEAQEKLIEESLVLHPVWYKVYKREVIADISFERNRYHEDVFWTYKVLGNTNTLSIIEDVGYYYWQRKGSIMGSNYSEKRLDGIDALCEWQDYLKIKYPELEGKGVLNIWFSCWYHGQKAILCLTKENQKNVFEKLKRIQKKYPVHLSDYKELKFTHKIWIIGSKVSLKKTCWIRNKLGVGL